MVNKQLLMATTLVVTLGWGQASLLSSFASVSAGPVTPALQSVNDGLLAVVRRSDRESRGADNKLLRLSPAEHLRRANIYMSNRAFEEAREHWQALIEHYSQDPRVAEALLGIGRSYFQSRRYAEAFATLERLVRAHGSTKEGREGLNFSAAALLRMGRPAGAAEKYIEYVERFPNGERIDTAHLNVIDALREAGDPQAAIVWIGRTRQRFAGTPTETNALFAQLRLDVAESNWKRAILTAEELSKKSFQKEVLTTPSEVAYLKAYSLECAGNRNGAFVAYAAIPDTPDSYYGWRATERLDQTTAGASRSVIKERRDRTASRIAAAAAQYPAPYRQAILNTAKARGLDPRLILAIIRQESVFRPQAKSPAGARGLLQLTIDAARKYASKAGLDALGENELYRPETSILLGGEYLAELNSMFPYLLEAVAASYNGGEDNVTRWVKRAKHKDPGVFTAEIGFDETKAYVQKVMSNYRAYRHLYTIDLERK